MKMKILFNKSINPNYVNTEYHLEDNNNSRQMYKIRENFILNCKVIYLT